MDDNFRFYAGFRDGSVSPIKDLSTVSKLPHYDFLLKVKYYKMHGCTYSEFIFIDEDDNERTFKLDQWEVLYIQPEDIYLKL